MALKNITQGMSGQTAATLISENDHLALNILNATVDYPPAEGFHTLETAVAAIPTADRKKGVVLIFEESARAWKRFAFVAPSLASWALPSSWEEETVGGSYNSRVFSMVAPAFGRDIRKYITDIKVQMLNNSNDTIDYVDGALGPLCVHSFGLTGGEYRLRLAEKVDGEWVVRSTPEFSQIGGEAPTSITFNYRHWTVTLQIKAWPDFTEFADYNLLNDYLFHTLYFANKLEALEPLSGLTFSTSSILTDLLEYSEAGDLIVTIPAVSVLTNKRHSSANVSPSGAIKTAYKLKRQEFLYVDIPKTWAIYAVSTGALTIQHGNFVAAVTDERGTTPQASIVSPDKDYIRYILIMTGNSPYMITKNNLPQNAATRKLNAKVFQWSRILGGVDLNDVVDDLKVTINSNANELNTFNVDHLPEIAIYSIGRQSGTSRVRIGEYVNGAWTTSEIYNNTSNALEFTATYRHFTLTFKLRSWPTFAEFHSSHRLNADLFQVPYILNKVNYLEPVSGISYSTGQSIKNIVTYKDGLLHVDVAGTCVMYNKRFVGVEARTASAARTVYQLKRQEFLYVDILKSWAIAGFKPAGYTHGTIQHGNYVAAVTDERGTTPQASIVSPDKDYIRYILIMTGNSPYMITKNNLPQTPTVEQVREIVEEETGGGVDSDRVVAAATWAAKNQLHDAQLRRELSEKIKDGYVPKWYGVEFTETSLDDCVRISSEGDEDLHVSLPIQSKIRRCITKDNQILYFLHPDNSELKEDGSPAKLDGSDGNFDAILPWYYERIEEEEVGGVRKIRIKISEDAIPGFRYIPESFTSAVEATVDRENGTLASVVTTLFTRSTQEVKIEASNFYAVGTSYSLGSQKTAEISGYASNAARFRGGVNNAALDAASGDDISRCQLGRPVANVTRQDLRGWTGGDKFMHLYDNHRKLFVLAFVEFARKNIQVPIVPKDPEGVTQGGLGKGATVYPDYDSHANFYTPYGGISLLPTGVTTVLGNKSGEVYFKIKNAPVESVGDKETFSITRRADVWMPVMSYRGVENYYGHIYKIADQVNIIATATGDYVEGHAGEAIWQITDVSYYYEPNPYLTNVYTPENKKIWQGRFQGYSIINSLLFGPGGHVLPIGGEGFNNQANYCDCTEIFPQGASRVVYPTYNGRIVSGELVGYNFIVGMEFEGDVARASDGTRLDHF